MAVSQVAKTIFEQINGNRLHAMVGAKNFGADGDAIYFSFPQAKDGINNCRIDYNYGTDLYTIKFGRVAKKDGIPIYTQKAIFEDVYFDMFDDIFESTTGLFVHL